METSSGLNAAYTKWKWVANQIDPTAKIEGGREGTLKHRQKGQLGQAEGRAISDQTSH